MPTTRTKAKLSSDGKWLYYPTPYLVQHVPTQQFYLRKRFGKEIVQRKLETVKLSEAKERIPLKIAEVSRELALETDPIVKNPGKASTFENGAEIYLKELMNDGFASEATRLHRSTIVGRLQTLWDRLSSKTLSQISHNDCVDFFTRVGNKYSNTHYNALLWVFREVLKRMRKRDSELGLPVGADPVDGIKQVKVPYRDVDLPSHEKLNTLLEYLDTHNSRSGFLVRIALHTGARWGEVSKMTWGDVDLERGQVKLVCGKRSRKGGHSSVRFVPMIADAREFFTYWKTALSPQDSDRVMPGVMPCRRHLVKACAALKIKRLRFHDFRHYFATRCIEAHVDVPGIANWLGHVDGESWRCRSTATYARSTAKPWPPKSRKSTTMQHTETSHRLSPPVEPAGASAPLSPRENKELRRLEDVIEAGLRTFIEVGRALIDIRDQRLYRGAHATFDDYCRDRWGMSKTHANRLIASAVTVENLGDVDILPANEAQVRPLTLLPPDRQQEAWEKAVETVGGVRKITASVVSQVVDEMLAEGKAKIHRRPANIRFVDRDRLVKDLMEFCERHQLVLPRKILDFLRKY